MMCSCTSLLGPLLMFFLLCQTCSGADISGLEHEPRLMASLLERAALYGKYTRPKKDYGVALNVSFGLRILKIGVDVQKSRLILSAWCRVLWYDENLTWNSSNFGGISRLHMPTNKVWTPDITLVNSAQTMGKSDEEGMLSLHSTGRIFWSPHRVFYVPCLFTLQDYPWDQYSCDLWFQSLGYSEKVLYPVLYPKSPLDLETYSSTHRELDEWKIVANKSAEVPQPRDEGAILMYSRRKSLRMTLTLRRRTGFMSLLLTIPCFLFSIMSCLVFCIPPARPDRLAFGNSLFAAFMVFMLILAASVPPTSGAFPRLGLLYGFDCLLIITSIFLSVLNINLNKRGTSGTRVPRWLDRVLLRAIGPILLVNAAPCQTAPKEDPQKENLLPHWFTGEDIQDTRHRSPQKTEYYQPMGQMMSNRCRTSFTYPEEVYSKATSARNSLTPAQTSTKQWEDIVTVLDRAFVIIYIVAIFFGNIFLFPWPR